MSSARERKASRRSIDLTATPEATDSLKWSSRFVVQCGIVHRRPRDLRGYWAVTLRANWRIIFRFEGGKALHVDLVDYH